MAHRLGMLKSAKERRGAMAMAMLYGKLSLWLWNAECR